jgi:peptide/nickel transport system substrate-binding protein
MRVRFLLVGLILLLAAPVAAKPFRLATVQDAATLDPHANNSASTMILLGQIYEPLIERAPDLSLKPALALRWQQVEPTRWRFTLRDNVRFAGGEPFSAEDVAFSVTRARQPTSGMGIFVDTVTEAVVVDRLTVDLVTRAPDAVVPDKLTSLLIMSKAWAEANNATRPQNFREREETATVRAANGTGPFALRSRENDVRTQLARNAAWWGGETSVTEYHHVTITSDATRIAALLSGEVDLVLFTPAQDIARLRNESRIRVLEGVENRTVMLGMDQWRDELLHSDVKGKNPFRDERVRRALSLAIDMDAIHRRTLRGLGHPTGSMWTRWVNGFDADADRRTPADLAAARRLLAEAGYPNGFAVTMDCPVGFYDEVCQALATVTAQVGIRITPAIVPNAQWLQKVARRETSLYAMSWGVPTFDASYTIRALMLTREAGGASSWNHGGYSNAEVDRLTGVLETETDPEKRRQTMRDIHRLHAADYGHIPLYNPPIPWVMRTNIEVTHRADNQLRAKDVTVR